MCPMNRRDFIKNSGKGLAVAAVSGFFADMLAAEKIPGKETSIFIEKFGVSKEDMQKVLLTALSKGGEFAELFFEYSISNNVVMEDDIIKNSSQNISLGVGIRVMNGEQTGYAYTNELTFEKMKDAALTSAAIASAGTKFKKLSLESAKPLKQVYDLNNTLDKIELESKIDVVKRSYNAAKNFNSKITKVQTTLLDSIRYITIANSEGLLISDVQPQVRLITRATAQDGQNRNTGTGNGGGRVGMNFFNTIKTPEQIGKEAGDEAITLLSAELAEAGEIPVVLSSWQSGVMIHEAVGHPLEGDGNWKKQSIMWDKLNQMVANPIVTIYDDPLLPGERGSINIDDEGTNCTKAMLVENGKLVGYLHDKLSAKMMKVKPTGHGRRQTYQDIPIPRMTNTVLAPGNHEEEEIIKSVKRGFYAHTYQGGQVQGTGQFTFSVNLGYLIEDGKITKPLKNATLIGQNTDILQRIEMISKASNTFLGNCGKSGQTVEVTCVTPTLKISKMTVGGKK